MRKNKYDLTILYAVDRKSEFLLFSDSLRIILKRNAETNLSVRVCLFFKGTNHLVKCLIEDLFLIIKDTNKNERIVVDSIDISKDSKNEQVIDCPMFWYVNNLDLNYDSDYLLWLDNDTVPFFSFEWLLKGIDPNEKWIIKWKKGSFVFNNQNILTKQKYDLATAHNGIGVDINEKGNGGFVLINTESLKSHYNNFSDLKFKKDIEYYIDLCNRAVGKNIYSDEGFFWLLFHGKIDTNLHKNLNILPTEILEKGFNEENFSLHLFTREKGEKIRLSNLLVNKEYEDTLKRSLHNFINLWKKDLSYIKKDEYKDSAFLPYLNMWPKVEQELNVIEENISSNVNEIIKIMNVIKQKVGTFGWEEILLESEITMVITVYQYNPKEIDYWKNIYKISKTKNIPFHWVIDNPEISSCFDFVNNDDLFLNEVNCGKLMSIINHVNQDRIKTKYFKIFDPDDYVDIESFTDLKVPSGRKIIRTDYFSLEGGRDYSLDKLNLEINREKARKKASSYANYCTIYPTEGLRLDGFLKGLNLERVRYLADHIMGSICFYNGHTVWYSDICFYYYRTMNGISGIHNMRTITHEMKNSLEVWEKIILKLKCLTETDSPFWIFDFSDEAIRKFKKENHYPPEEEKKLRETINYFSKYRDFKF